MIRSGQFRFLCSHPFLFSSSRKSLTVSIFMPRYSFKDKRSSSPVMMYFVLDSIAASMSILSVGSLTTLISFSVSMIVDTSDMIA